jgi:hypothetical protein
MFWASSLMPPLHKIQPLPRPVNGVLRGLGRERAIISRIDLPRAFAEPWAGTVARPAGLRSPAGARAPTKGLP